MKRIHLFEFEDQSWFPDVIRRCMTRLIIVMHKLLNSSDELAELLAKNLKETNSRQITDLCSGSGGPMIEVVKKLKEKQGFDSLRLTMTDLYPNLNTAESLNAQNESISYQTQPIDATNVPAELSGFRTMICSFHHMKPETGRKILESALKSRQGICIFEISDNSFPKYLWWTAIPFNILSCLFITPFARPMSWQQIIFTYLIPVIPICFAWDGAVSNIRTYTLSDLDILLEGLQSEDYQWDKGIIKGKAKKLYLIGRPV